MQPCKITYCYEQLVYIHTRVHVYIEKFGRRIQRLVTCLEKKGETDYALGTYTCDFKMRATV